jgi:hypothetical protein
MQANSILQHATIIGTNYYSSNFIGPPDQGFTIAGALASLDVLVMAMGPGSTSQADSSPTSISTDPTQSFS